MALRTKIEVLVLSFAISPGVTAPPIDVDKQTRIRCGGENSAYQPTPNGTIQCFTKRGHPTFTISGVQ